MLGRLRAPAGPRGPPRAPAAWNARGWFCTTVAEQNSRHDAECNNERRNVAEITDFIFPFHPSQVGTSTSEQQRQGYDQESSKKGSKRGSGKSSGGATRKKLPRTEKETAVDWKYEMAKESLFSVVPHDGFIITCS